MFSESPDVHSDSLGKEMSEQPCVQSQCVWHGQGSEVDTVVHGGAGSTVLVQAAQDDDGQDVAYSASQEQERRHRLWVEETGVIGQCITYCNRHLYVSR